MNLLVKNKNKIVIQFKDSVLIINVNDYTFEVISNNDSITYKNNSFYYTHNGQRYWYNVNEIDRERRYIVSEYTVSDKGDCSAQAKHRIEVILPV